jgi:hypothetical protein
MPPPSIDEKTFESSFAEMALTTLKNRAPAMVDYMMGFQLVDRSEDDTRAVGFFGFKVGHNWVYVPSFFLAGEIKGTELMYVKEQDVFLPLEEGWVNYLIQRKPFVLGKGAPEDRQGQGVQGIDLRRLRVPPSDTKTASAGLHIYGMDALADWAPGGAQMFIEKEIDGIRSLPQFLAFKGASESFIQLMKSNQKVASAALTFYKVEDFRHAAKDETAARKLAGAGGLTPAVEEDEDDKERVRVIDRDTAEKDHTELRFLSDDEKKRIMTGQVLVDDRRSNDGVRKTYGIELTKSLTNPTEPGLYDVLTVGGEFNKMLVLAPATVGGGGNRDIRMVIDPKTRDYQLQWKSEIWTSRQYDRQDLEKEVASIGADMSSKPETGQRWDASPYVIIDGRGSLALGPFSVDSTIVNSNKTTHFLVCLRSISIDGRSGNRESRVDHSETHLPFEGPMFSEDGEIDLNPDGQSNKWHDARGHLQILVTDKKISRFIHGDGATMVPRDNGFRLVKLGKGLTSVRSTGSVADLHMRIGKFAEVIKLYNDGHRLAITGDTVDTVVPLSQTKQAFEVLLRDLHLDEESTRQLYKTACENPRQTQRYYARRIEPQQKTAAPFDRVMGNTGVDPWLGIPVQDSDGQRLVEQLEEYRTEDPTNREKYRHERGENNAFERYYNADFKDMQGAAESGQKDVFDAAAIGSLIKVTDVGGEIDRFVPDLIKAVDKLGRMLFLIYWHGEDVQERYGRQEIQHVEDNVKSVFESLGETILELKKKSPVDEEILGTGTEGI